MSDKPKIPFLDAMALAHELTDALPLRHGASLQDIQQRTHASVAGPIRSVGRSGHLLKKYGRIKSTFGRARGTVPAMPMNLPAILPKIINMDAKARLDEIRSEARSEVYGGNLDFGHVPLVDFLFWVQQFDAGFMKAAQCESLMGFDLRSVEMLFEEWVNGKHDELGPQ